MEIATRAKKGLRPLGDSEANKRSIDSSIASRSGRLFFFHKDMYWHSKTPIFKRSNLRTLIDKWTSYQETTFFFVANSAYTLILTSPCQ
jgi:hypothetical protein